MMKLVPATGRTPSPFEAASFLSQAFLWKSLEIRLDFFSHELLLQSSAKQAVVVRAKEAANIRAVFIVEPPIGLMCMLDAADFCRFSALQLLLSRVLVLTDLLVFGVFHPRYCGTVNTARYHTGPDRRLTSVGNTIVSGQNRVVRAGISCFRPSLNQVKGLSGGRFAVCCEVVFRRPCARLKPQ